MHLAVKIYNICSILCVIFIVFLISSASLITGLNFSKVNQSNTILDMKLNLKYEENKKYLTYFSEINCGPLPNPNVKGVALTEQFKKTGFDFVRTHDFNGPTDISKIFPDMNKDQTIPVNYNFSSSDEYISSIINANCHVFYRLGESANTNESLRKPPENMSKWAEVCKHIVMHYNDGWADGFYYNISYWEIWNEPDLTGFWNGTTEQYYKLYQETAVTLKQYDPTLKIGGPCTSSIFNKNFTTRFLTFVKENQIPLDFYSWHMYDDTWYQLYNGSKQIRSLLDSFGFPNTENINTEWNYDILAPQRDKDNAKNAAFTACALSAFQDAGIDYAFRYRSTQDNNPITRFIGFDLSLFSSDGLYKTPALSYLAFNYLFKDSPIRLQSPIVDSEQGITSLAGISEDGTNITILLSNFEAGDSNYELIIDHIPFDSSYIVAMYLIDDEHHLQIVDEFNSEEDQLEVQGALSQSSVQFIRITNSSVLPDEGPEPLEIPWFLKIPLFDPIAKILGALLMILFFS